MQFKKAIADSAIEAADVKVQETVAKIIADVKKRGDAAVRELSADASTAGRRPAFSFRRKKSTRLSPASPAKPSTTSNSRKRKSANLPSIKRQR